MRPPLVLLHSGFSTRVEWRSVIGLVSSERDVLAPTLPGSDGGAPLDLAAGTMLAAHADHVESLLDEAGWTAPVEVAGSSFGGVVAIELAARGRASSVVALAPPWPAGAGAGFYFALFSPVLAILALADRLPARLRANPRTALSLLLHGSRVPAAITPEDAAAILRSFGRFRFFRTGLELGVRGGFGPGMPDCAQVRAPVTLVWGGADRLVPGWMRHRWERALPGAVAETLPGLPHVPHLRDPDRIADLLLRGDRSPPTS